jgi:glycosyltransferase involved in cell wall biosynthesis
MSGRAGPRYIACFASLGSYRREFLRLMNQELGGSLLVLAGSSAPDRSLRLLDPAEVPYRPLRSRILPKDVILMRPPVLQLLRCEVLLLDLNPRIPLNWLLLAARRIMGKSTVLWGHAWPRQGKAAASDRLRHGMRWLATGLITYTRTQRQELAARHAGTPVTAAPNALYLRRQFAFEPSTARHLVLFVGRLIPAKKPALLLDAFEDVAAEHPDIQLVVVGDGPLRAEIETLRSRSKWTERIVLRGHVDDYGELKELYDRAFVSVSPGYVGLSATQSFSFGVPMVIADDEPHAPEIEAATEDNSTFFRSDDPRGLAIRLREMWHQRNQWHARGEEIARSCGAQYSVESMVEGVVTALRGQAQ